MTEAEAAVKRIDWKAVVDELREYIKDQQWRASTIGLPYLMGVVRTMDDLIEKHTKPSE